MADTLDSLIAQFQQYVVSPLNAFGLGGFAFDIEGETMANSSSDITDHYTEDNRALQDHIAIRPKRLTLKGYVGEVIFTDPNNSVTSIVQTVVQKLTTAAAFLPTLSAAATQAQNLIDGQTSAASLLDTPLTDAANVYALVKNILSNFTGDTPRQEQAYSYFVACQTAGILMGIQTPWEFLTNMAIESVVAIQDETTKYITDFAVTYKQIRIAKTSTTAYTSSVNANGDSTNVLGYTGNYPPVQAVTSESISPDQQFQGDAALQAQSQVSQGNSPGVSLPSNTLPGSQSLISSIADILPKGAAGPPSLSNIFVPASALSALPH